MSDARPYAHGVSDQAVAIAWGEFIKQQSQGVIDIRSMRAALEAAAKYMPQAATWKCGARAQGTAGGNDPADCDWPVCGCDPYATKVIESLQEQGWLAPDDRALS